MPESQPAASDVEVWAMESVFVHVTVVPDAMFRSSGAKALFPSVDAPTGMTTDEDDPSCAGEGAGDGVVEGTGDGAVDGTGDGVVEGDE